MSLVNNLFTQWKIEEENRTRDQSMKNFPTNEGDREENRKIKNIVNEKILQPGVKIGEKKPRLVEREKTCSKRDLFKEGLG